MLQQLPLLPEGTTLPPVPHLLVLVAAAGAVGLALRRRSPAVTERRILALAPWIVVGSCLYVLHGVEAVPALLRPFTSSPAVYVSTAVLAGATWLAAEARAEPADGTRATDGTDAIARTVAAVGAALVVPVAGAALATGISGPGAYWSAVSLAVAVPVAAAVWLALTRANPDAAATGGVGALVVGGHALDGVSTAVGVAGLGFGEKTPLSRWLLELGGLPSVPVLGDGWLFLLVKLAIASLVVHLFVPYVREVPEEGYALLGFVAAVGLGPGAHNLLLFAVAA